MAKKAEEKTGQGRVDINGEYVSSKQCEKLANHQCHPKQTVRIYVHLSLILIRIFILQIRLLLLYS